MKYLLLLLAMLSLPLSEMGAQNKDFSQKIIGDWIFDSIQPKELVVNNGDLKNDIEDQMVQKQQRFAGQSIELKPDGTFITKSSLGPNEGVYLIDGNQLTLTVDGFPLIQMIESISDDTLTLYMDETDLYQNSLSYMFPDYANAVVSKVVTHYIYTRKKILPYEGKAH